MRGAGLVMPLVLLSWLANSSADAQATRVLLLPTAGEESLRSERQAIEQALAAALSKQLVTVLKPSAAELATLDAQACGTADCALALLPTLRAELAVSSALWNKEQTASGRASVTVMLVDRAGERYPGDAVIDADLDSAPETQGIESAAQAADAALLAAQSLRLLGRGPWIEVRVAPEHGVLFVDGVRVGHAPQLAPYRTAIAAGAHELRVEAPGQLAWASVVDIPLRTRSVVALRVDLVTSRADVDGAVLRDGRADVSTVQAEPQPATPSHAFALHTGTPQVESAAFSYVLGSALVIAGAAVLIAPIRTLATEGDCVGARDLGGRCAERIHAGASTIALLAVGGALIAGGVTTLLARPFRVAVAAGPDSARAQLYLTF